MTFLLASLAYAMGGLPWLFPLGALYGLYLLARPTDGRQAPTDLDDVFPTAAGSLVMVMAFAHTGSDRLYLPYLVTVSVGGAVALALVAEARQRRLWVAPAAALGALLPASAPLLLGESVPVAVVGIGGLLGLLLFVALSRTRIVGRRLLASLICGGIAWYVLG